MRPPRSLRFAVVAMCVALAGCSSHHKTTASRPSTTAVSGPLTVFAAASLTAAFTNAKPALTSAFPRLSLSYNFAGSNTLVAQIKQGAPADVFASADTKNMQVLVDAAHIEEEPVGLEFHQASFARNFCHMSFSSSRPSIRSIQSSAA